MAEGSYRKESEGYNVEDMDEGSDEVGEEDMVEGNDYEEFGAFGGYGALTSFDIRILRAFGSLGPGFRILANEPWELENPVLARTLLEAFRMDPETLANETAARAANVARAAASNQAARAAATAARATYNQVVTNHHPVATHQASGGDTQPMTSAAQAPAATPETSVASPHSSRMLVNSEMAAPGAPARSPQPQTSSQAQEAAAEGPSTACAFPQASRASEMDATRPKTAFLGQNDAFDFSQPAGVSGMAFPRPKRPAPAQEAATEGPSVASRGTQAASAGEGAATRPKTTKSGKALAKTRWVEPQNVVAAAAAKAKMATSIPEPESAAATSQQSAEPWARMGGKRTKKSKHLDDEYESGEEEREPPAVPPTWRASQPLLTTARPQVAPRPSMALRSQVPSRHVLCLPPRNVTLLQERANKLVKYLMIKDYKKIPIKRSDMLKDVIREYDEHFPEIIERATYTLEKKFGIHLKEIDKEEHLYILVCTRDSSARLLGKTKDTPRLSLLLVILGVIFMNGNRASEAVLWEALRKMGLRPGVRHPFLGDLRKLITEDFVKQKYLEYKKVPNSSPPEYEFLWGLRACHETSKMRVLRFIAQYQNRDPREWRAHFLEAVDDAFKTMDVDMAEEHARAQMRAQMNIGEEALIGRWSWDDIQVELLTWDEDGDFGDAWSRIPFAFWARYHQYILNSNRANRRGTWRAGVSSGTNGAASASMLDGPSTSSTIRTRNAARTSASFFSWIQQP
ncbi:melanoma-associated antigen D4 isoform X1 [Bos indicus x Bos taurus]|nr:melanoma-associated antigen D4 isoform X1 [Bos taurus]XP_024843466.1 melanoma-associated antigen D4 isoform X1 [Bos taurus]XP_024843467.1 melanoma-associated antigen D4 isoform X1 [Bos taurus]XP_027390096.1 melanoma-associated antigen D4 isoform X1 [Bos indicus x Bos taurus]XP_027390097.1 melanoma-associated antigen D4 isoform X1 [Bos indicus x Bos taurus]XP_027390098.1 melanoma-associated antigen D4 isoform X1 [Bos indicus x Bos taurus]XP_027390101.1 melanoma-associated antigen D4 isoform